MGPFHTEGCPSWGLADGRLSGAWHALGRDDRHIERLMAVLS